MFSAGARVGSLLSIAGVALACGGEAEPPPRRNVVLVTIDTLRADALSAYGQPRPTSPRIDQLAREGVLFEQCAAPAPNTVPSHATILTGKQPYAHGVRSNVGYVLAPQHVTLAEVLRERGYRTAAEVASIVMGRRTLMDQGFDEYRDLDSFDVRPLRIHVGDTAVTLPERAAPDVTRRGIQFLERHATTPFFLWLHYFDPHAFYTPPARYREIIPDSRYHGEVRYVDDHVGAVVDALERLGLADRTLLVVTSDHGESLGEHGEVTHSFYVYETTMRVPLILRGPGLPAGPQRIGALVRSADIAPTVLDLLGLPPLRGAQGVSLRPLLDGTRADLGLVGYGESAEVAAIFGTSVFRFVREGRWKYIHRAPPELYDLEADPGEVQNLAAEREPVVERLRERLAELLRDAPAPAATAASLDLETRQGLLALGYAALGRQPGIDARLARLELGEEEPEQAAADVQSLQQAWSLLQRGQREPALALFRQLAERHPGSGPILIGLLETLRRLGRAAEVAPQLRAAVAADPRAVDLRVELARLEVAAGRFAEAERLLGEVLALEPCAVVAQVERAGLLHRQARHADQVASLEEATRRCPDSADLRNDLAYALATSPEPELRDGPRAVQVARAVVQESRGGRPAYLDTLAAALAEVGRFEEAVRREERALQLLDERDTPETVRSVFAAHLASFRAGRPIRD